MLVFVLIVSAALWLYPPTQSSFWPRCPVYQYLGIECPGCGATRALAALLHGHLLLALRLNALFILLLPVGLVGSIRTYLAALKSSDWRWPQLSHAEIYSVVAASAVFTVMRNLIR